MLKKLKQRWGVNELNLVLIIATFAIGGSLCGFVGRKLLLLTNLEKGFMWIVLYVILITLLWPISVLVVSIPLGQFKFFRKYIRKIWRKTRGAKTVTQGNIAIFASGAGSNAKKIIEYFNQPGKKEIGQVRLVVCNKPGAGVLEIAKENNIPTLLIDKERFFTGDGYLDELKQYNIDLVVLAGFLWKLPVKLIHAFPAKIINIHPALLPKYGGKGMYGNHVHSTVINNKEKESGISIHYVDEVYDNGEIIFQATCEVNETDTAASLAEKIHKLEHANYPAVIEKVLKSKI
jgi:formyltetrahydrofolate-dependent phosphoribosylglycinamide formyltransferase